MYSIQYEGLVNPVSFLYNERRIPKDLNIELALLRASNYNSKKLVIIGTARLIGLKKAKDNLDEARILQKRYGADLTSISFIPIFENLNLFRSEQYIENFSFDELEKVSLNVYAFTEMFNIKNINLDYDEVISIASSRLDYSNDYRIENNTLIHLYDIHEKTVLPESCIKTNCCHLSRSSIKEIVVSAKNFEFINNNFDSLPTVNFTFEHFELFLSEPFRLKLFFPIDNIEYLPQLKDDDGNYSFNEVCYSWSNGNLQSIIKKVTIGNWHSNYIYVPDHIEILDLTHSSDLLYGTKISLPSKTKLHDDTFYDLLDISFRDKPQFYYVSNDVIYSLDKKTLLHYPLSKKEEIFEIPEHVTNPIFGHFDNCTNLKYVICDLRQIHLSEALNSSHLFFLLKDSHEIQYITDYYRASSPLPVSEREANHLSKRTVQMYRVIPRILWEVIDGKVTIK
ncbi:MAG: hypothetical protein RBQ86_04040 [Candidatus Izemoplasmatales bacterium]|nr:hypothetical protein [Candidatus Izemoplasmatales bacterium]